MKKINVKETVGLMNLAMADHMEFRGTPSQLMQFFNETIDICIKNVWADIRPYFVEVGHIKNVKVYSFPKDDLGKLKPMHYSVLESALAKRSAYTKQLNQKKHKGNDSEKLAKKMAEQYQQATKSSDISEEDAIDLLKSLGYKIFKPVTDYQEI